MFPFYFADVNNPNRQTIKGSNTTTHHVTSNLPSLTTDMELANLLISLVIHSYRNISVFWRASRLFSLIYWLQSVAAIVLHLLSHYGFQTLLKEDLTNEMFILDETSLATLYIISNFLLVISSWCVFHFGHCSVNEMMCRYLKQLGCYKDFSNGDWAAYLPHGFALFSILIYVACNAPIMYDYVSVYTQMHNQILIVHLTACVIYMLLWIILWFLFTVKQSWNFKIDECSLKKFAVLQNHRHFFPGNDPIDSEDVAENVQTGNPQPESFLNKFNNEDSLSNSTTSTINGCISKSANGILTHKVHSKHKRSSCEQKVKFQEATKIVIETNLDSDLDTIPESDTECADSAMFSGSNDSTESHSAHLSKRLNYADLILNPKTVPMSALDSRRRMWKSTGDLSSAAASWPGSSQPFRPSSVMSEQNTSNHTAPFSPRNRSTEHAAFNSFDMSSAV